MGVWGQFPQYRGREGEIGTLEERINDCLERSMNGHVMPLDGREMKAYLAYMKWLSTGVPDGAKLIGAGMKSIKEPGRAADLDDGAKVFADTCASCHSKDGLGQCAENGPGYRFPPLAGPDSYNNGAGMTRVLTAAAFVRHNMPFGITFDTPVLSDADAYDVAAYMNSLDVRSDLISTRIFLTSCRSPSIHLTGPTQMISHLNNTDTVRSIRSGPRYESLPQRKGRAELGPAVAGFSLHVPEKYVSMRSENKKKLAGRPLS
jgi:cytochrome c